MTHDPEVSRLIEGYPVSIELPIQWGDQDAFGHVNNTIPLRWFESARIAYMGRAGLSELYARESIGPILASITANYRGQLRFPDSVLVGARITRIGRTSLAMEHVAISLGGRKMAVEGSSVLVVFDYKANLPHPVPESIRSAIGALEGRALS